MSEAPRPPRDLVRRFLSLSAEQRELLRLPLEGQAKWSVGRRSGSVGVCSLSGDEFEITERPRRLKIGAQLQLELHIGLTTLSHLTVEVVRRPDRRLALRLLSPGAPPEPVPTRADQPGTLRRAATLLQRTLFPQPCVE